VRRLSVTAVEVSWDPPAFHGVAGYRVEYAAITDDDDQRRPRFLDTGPYTVAQVPLSSSSAAAAAAAAAASCLAESSSSPV